MIHRLMAGILTSLVLFSAGVPAVYALSPNDALYFRQWYLPHIGAPEAWERTTGSPEVIVAVVDTVMDIDHEDLRENIWTNPGEIPDNGIDDEGNGFVDDVHGWNFERRSNNVRANTISSTEGYIHATLVASLIGARGNNGMGIAGVAWNARLMPVVALDGYGGGSIADVASAIRYAVDNGAQIINVSLEGYTDAAELDDALIYAQARGVLTVAAAGNGETAAGIQLSNTRVYPVCSSEQPQFGVMGVGSTTMTDQKAPYANFGPCLNVSAPGNEMFAAVPPVPGSSESQYEGGYSGTSLAAPLVSGTAALLKSLRPDWRWAELRNHIMMTAAPIDHLQETSLRGQVGRGRLDIGAAVRSVSTSSIESVRRDLSASVPGKPTVVTAVFGSQQLSLMPFGSADKRGARASFADMDGDAIPEIIVVPASGRVIEAWVFSNDGKQKRRVSLATNGKEGALVAGTEHGFLVADPASGRAWGVSTTGTVRTISPYGTAYRAGIDMIEVPGGAAFAPRGGGGHLVLFDAQGKRLLSAFPFGKSARGRWSVSRTGLNTGFAPSLIFSGPLGTRSLAFSAFGSDRWEDLSLAVLQGVQLQSGTGRVISGSTDRAFVSWPR